MASDLNERRDYVASLANSMLADLNLNKVGGKQVRFMNTADMNNLVQTKISELQIEQNIGEEDEKHISAAVKAAKADLKSLLDSKQDKLVKINCIADKYAQLFGEMKKLEREYVKAKKKAELLQKDREVTKEEYSKALNFRQRLESLCRELQKENKRIKEESKVFAQNEQTKREELSSRFECTIREIKSKMETNTLEANVSAQTGTADTHDIFKDKFVSFLEQYDLREQHYLSSIRVKELEAMAANARADSFRKNMEREKARAQSLHTQVITFGQTEAELRGQLNVYVEKFKQVEDTLNSSNDLFLTFRKEMEQMTKKTKKVEKENASVRAKCDTMNRNILEMAKDQTKLTQDLANSKKREAKLETLCRALQAQRDKKDESNVSNGSEEPSDESDCYSCRA